MPYAAQFVVFLVVAFGGAIGMWPLYRTRGASLWVPHFASVAILFSPLVIRSEHITLRALACVLAVDLFFKTTDYAAQWRQPLMGDRGFLSYARFLLPFPVFLVRFGARTRDLSFSWAAFCATGVGCLGVALGFALVELVSRAGVARSSFLLDHSCKFFIFTLTIESLARVLHGLERLAGYNTEPLIRDAWRSRTVGEFWWRYNSRVHAWFARHVFRPVRMRFGPRQAVCLTFLASGILHEIGFAIATSGVYGYQFMFFCLQAPAVILCRFVEKKTVSWPGNTESTPWTKKPEVAHIQIMVEKYRAVFPGQLTVFFFHGVDSVFPFFYVSEPWLP